MQSSMSMFSSESNRGQKTSRAAMEDYDVFLNHRGPDVKGGFIAHLHDALRSAGLNPFLDKKSLVKGSPVFTSIDAALEGARVYVAVVSRGYAESKCCLSELVVMMRSKKPVIPVFYDVEPAELRRVEKGQFAAAFEKHKSRESEKQVQEWADALGKLADVTGFCFRLADYQGDDAELKHEVVNAIISLLPSHHALQVESHLVGLEEHIRTCVSELKKMSGGVGVLGLVGMGGIGKTSLAKVIYNNLLGHKQFRAVSFLEIGRHSPSSIEVGSNMLNRLQKQLLWDLLRIPRSRDEWSYEYWFGRLSREGPVLIVLDDIQDKEQFDKLICNRSLLAAGSCIIVTSRDRHVLKVIGGNCSFYLHEMTALEGEDSEKVFNWHAFGDEEAPKDFEVLAKDVSKACGGLPLALKVVGLSLFGMTSNEEGSRIWPEAIEALKKDPGVMNCLKWSYNCLSEAEKLMFVDIACVFCGWEKDKALEIWESCKSCSSCCGNGAPNISLRHLIDKSLVIVEDREVLTMHDLLRDMGQDIGEVEGSHLWKGKAIKVVQDKNQNSNKVRAMCLANSGKQKFDIKKFRKMPYLHFLILDGCDVGGNIGSISKELRYLQWRQMPLAHFPPMLNLSNLIALDFSESTKLADTWLKSEPALEGCPNLLRLNLARCMSITRLPDSIGHLSKLQVLTLNWCQSLQKLPNCIGQLTALEELHLGGCGKLEALPNSITALSNLQWLLVYDCSSISKLPETIGHMTGLYFLGISLISEQQVLGIGQLNTLDNLFFTKSTDEAISVLDKVGTLKNMHQLYRLRFYDNPCLTKLPETIGQLVNLVQLQLWKCERVRELPNSIGQLKILKFLFLRQCNDLKMLPDSLGTLTSLQELCIVDCSSLIKLPMSIGHLSGLQVLMIEGCALQTLPDSLRHLNALQLLQIFGCGNSLEGLGLLRLLQGLRIWGCTSVTNLPGSYLVVVDSNFKSPTWIFDGWDLKWVRRNLKEVELVEMNDCGFLHWTRDLKIGCIFLQRVYNLPCCKLTSM